MSDLEQQYRRALRWYPPGWRAQHEQALLGILLDQANEEGRTHMSSADRRNLARNGVLRRAYPVLLIVLLVLGLLAAIQIVSMLLSQTGLDSQLLFSPPPLHPVPIGTSWTPLFVLSASGGATYLTCSLVVITATSGAVLLIRSMRRA